MRRLASAVLVAAVLLVGPGCDEDQNVTAPPLVAECQARPSAGAAPLRVTFLLTVSGAEGRFNVAISYGDGTTGTDPDTAHVYSSAGSFTASMVVTTATQSARCSAPVTVTAGATPSPSPSASPSPGANLPPVAVFKSTPDAVGGRVTGTAPFVVRWNMCATTDPERDTLYFLMDFDGDRRFDVGGTTGAHCRAEHAYGTGTWATTLCVHDRGPDGQPLHDDICRTFTVVASP